MTPSDLLSTLLRHQAIAAMAEKVVAKSKTLDGSLRNNLCFLMGEARFHKGDYAAANRYYASVAAGPRLPEARRMADWTAHKLGHIEIGWPRYPVAEFNPHIPRPQASRGLGVVVREPTRPFELIDDLGLKPWQNGDPTLARTLVWFNFFDSLGGELFTARALQAIPAHLLGPEPVIAIDTRLHDVLRAALPNAVLISKNDDLSPFKGILSHYFLARDALRLALQQPGGLSTLAAQRFRLPPREVPVTRRRPTFAITWKTTNRRQGRYRNIPFDLFARTLAASDCAFVSAQHGVTARERRLMSGILQDRIDFDSIDTKAGVTDFAGSLADLNGVITADNSVLHIAGAFALPTVALLSIPSYWAWPSEGNGSRWYESVEVIHQDRPGDWRSVLEALSRLLSGEARPTRHTGFLREQPT